MDSSAETSFPFAVLSRKTTFSCVHVHASAEQLSGSCFLLPSPCSLLRGALAL
jgi:hypothetical protein